MGSFKPIRDFVYMDIDLLYSLYSQVFEGVANQIFSSRTNEGASKEIDKQSLLSGNTSEELVSEASNEAKSIILHDHLYTQLEESLDTAIFKPDNLSRENYAELLQNTFMVKVAGKAEIEDYSRISEYTDSFNELLSATHYVSNFSELPQFKEYITTKLQELEVSTRSADKSRKAKYAAEIKQLREYRALLDTPNGTKDAFAMLKGHWMDSTFLQCISYTLRTFRPDGFDISVLPNEGSSNIVFRGILNKDYLRMKPEYLRSLYGGSVQSKWTMVGQITFIPKHISSPTSSDDQILDDEHTSEVENHEPSIRDAIRTFFAATKDMERTFFDSKSRVEVLVRPLAIYQELSIPNNASQSV